MSIHRRLAVLLVFGVPLLIGTNLIARDPPRPDLIIDRPLMESDWAVGWRYFTPTDCMIQEGCVIAPGIRKLLIFSVQTANISQTNLELGDPVSSPFFQFSPCHGHYHLLEFSDYQITAPGGGSTLVTSRKQDWCLSDIEQYVFQPWVSQTPTHFCENQGILGGWSDIYGAGLDCQWLDVTDLPPGDYDLTAIVNAGGRIHESDYSNNRSTIPVTVPDISGDPDLIPISSRMAATVRVEEKTFAASDPAVLDGCLGGYGARRLLRFDMVVANVSQADLYIGDPVYQSLIAFSFPHKHHHLAEFITYQLFDTLGNPVTPARSPVWLPADMDPYLVAPWVSRGPFYWAQMWMATAEPVVPGIQRGWSSTNPATRDCQWVDVSGVPDGFYRLRATVNPSGVFRESNLGNNTAEVTVSLAGGAEALAHRPENLEVVAAPGGFTRILYDVSPDSCPAAQYNVYYSDRVPGDYRYTGGVCDVGTSGDAAIVLPDPAPGGLVWFLLVGRSGNYEGGHGFDSRAQPRPLTGAGLCGIAFTAAQNRCGEL